MRRLTILAGLFLLAGSHVALSADAVSNPIIVAAVNAKPQAPKSMVTRETSVPEGSLEKFGSVGLPR